MLRASTFFFSPARKAERSRAACSRRGKRLSGRSRAAYRHTDADRAENRRFPDSLSKEEPRREIPLFAKNRDVWRLPNFLRGAGMMKASAHEGKTCAAFPSLTETLHAFQERRNSSPFPFRENTTLLFLSLPRPFRSFSRGSNAILCFSEEKTPFPRPPRPTPAADTTPQDKTESMERRLTYRLRRPSLHAGQTHGYLRNVSAGQSFFEEERPHAVNS